jgi:magnesium transporter
MRFPSQKITSLMHQLQKQTHHTHTSLEMFVKIMHIMYDKTLRYLDEEGKKVFQLQESLVAKRKSEKKFLDDLLNQKINAITMLHDFNAHKELLEDFILKAESVKNDQVNHDFHMHDLKSKLRKIVASIRLMYQTLDALINTYNAFMNMNTNMIAMTLTVFTAIIGVCNLFVGMYGMNVKLPGQEYDHTFYYIISGLLILGSIMSFFFYRISVMRKYK